MQFDFSKTHQFIQLLTKDWAIRNGKSIQVAETYDFQNYFEELERARIAWKQEYHQIYVTEEFRRYARFLLNEIENGITEIKKRESLLSESSDSGTVPTNSLLELLQLYPFQVEQLDLLASVIERDKQVRINSDFAHQLKKTPQNVSLVQQDFIPRKITFRTRQVDIFALLWLFKEAKLIEPITNTDLTNFAKHNFSYTKLGKSMEMKDVSNALSKLSNKEIENFQREEIKSLRLLFNSLNEVLISIESTQANKID